MKHNLKLITLLSLGAFSMSAFAQAPNASTPTVVTNSGTKVVVNDTPAPTNVGEGNAFEQSVTPLLRQISKLKSDLEIKKLQKEIEKLDAVEKKDDQPTGFVPMPSAQPAQMQITAAQQSAQQAAQAPIENSIPVKVLMTYGAEDDLYAKVSVGDQGGYTIRKGDVLPDGRLVLSVKSNYIEVEKAKKLKSKKSTTEKIFVSTGSTTSNQGNGNGNGQNQGFGGTKTNNVNFTAMPSANVPSMMPMPAINSSTSRGQQLK